MQPPVVIVGIGEIGGVFARGLLRTQHPVYPVTRLMDLAQAAAGFPEPARVLVTVAEDDLGAVLATMPPSWAGRLVLVQNELLPRDWRAHAHIDRPTIVSIWFEKKPGADPRVLLPSPAFGPGAGLVHDALASLQIPVRVLGDEDELLFELVRKNLYILTTNIAGLVTGGTVESLWRDHRDLARAVATDVLAVQATLTATPLDQARLMQGLVEAFDADPEHRCTGRSAPARLARTLAHAAAAGLAVPALRDLEARARA